MPALQEQKTRAELARALSRLAEAKPSLREMQAQMAQLDQTVAVDKDTIDTKMSDLARLAKQTRALTALRDELEKQAQAAAARATTEQQKRQAVEALLADEKSSATAPARRSRC